VIVACAADARGEPGLWVTEVSRFGLRERRAALVSLAESYAQFQDQP
jgi:hypothetical protein